MEIVEKEKEMMVVVVVMMKRRKEGKKVDMTRRGQPDANGDKAKQS